MITVASSPISYTGTYPGRADQLTHMRAVIAKELAACPVADEAILVASEIAANAIMHTRSGAPSGEFTVRVWADVSAPYVTIQVQDQGGTWRMKPRGDDDRPHGFDLLDGLCGPEGWGIQTQPPGRIVWARLSLSADHKA
jgi:serine/threonine-protein kinase RsbW